MQNESFLVRHCATPLGAAQVLADSASLRLLRQRHLLAARHSAARGRAAARPRRGRRRPCRASGRARSLGRAARRRHVLHQGLSAGPRQLAWSSTRASSNRVVEVNAADRYITVEAGCTWAQVNAALDGTGLRTGYWGPLSGVNATVGGALSQNSAFFGSALNGTVAEACSASPWCWRTAQIVDHRLGRSRRHQALHARRRAGPHRALPGRQRRLRAQVSATLRLCAARRQRSASCPSASRAMNAMAAAQVEMARTRLVSEGFGIDRTKARALGQRQPASSDGLKIARQRRDARASRCCRASRRRSAWPPPAPAS